MEKLKVKVGSGAESKEVKELFSEFGLNMNGWSGFAFPKYISNFIDGEFSDYSIYDSGLNDWKEITIPELRDMVVLKRNDVVDATHEDGFDGKYRQINNVWYWFNIGKWKVSEQNWHYHNKLLKPIEKKEMKEYLVKSQDGKWCLETDLVGDPADNVIEVPDGAVKAYLNNSKTINFVNADDDYMNSVTDGKWIDTHRGKHEICGHTLVWQRNQEPKQAEFLVKTDSGYVLQVLDENAGGEDVVRVPDGADTALSGGGDSVYFYRKNDCYFNGVEWRKCEPDSIKTVNAYIETGAKILWQRETLNDQVASAEEYREMISNASILGRSSVVVDIAQSCSGGAIRNASSQGQSEFPLNNYELNHRVAKAFNAVRGTDLNEDDVNYLRELIDLTFSHYGERK